MTISNTLSTLTVVTDYYGDNFFHLFARLAFQYVLVESEQDSPSSCVQPGQAFFVGQL